MVSAVLCGSGVMNRQPSTTTVQVTRQHIWHLTTTPVADVEDSIAADVKEGIPTQQLISKYLDKQCSMMMEIRIYF